MATLKDPPSSQLPKEQSRTEFVQSTYAEQTKKPSYVIDSSISQEFTQTLTLVCTRPEFQPLLQDVSFGCSSDPQPLFRVFPGPKIILSQPTLDNPSLAAFHTRHALELVAWERQLSWTTDPATRLAIAIVGWHTAVSYFDTMIVHEKQSVSPFLPEWMTDAMKAVHRNHEQGRTPVELATAIGEYGESLLLLQDFECKGGLEPVMLQRGTEIAANALLLASPSEKILTTIGDTRLLVDEQTGLNSYGCSPRPRPWAITFSSCTATSISDIAYGEAERCRQSFFSAGMEGNLEKTFVEATEAIRKELSSLLELHHVPGHEIIFTPSGTYAELYPLCFALDDQQKPVVNIIVAPEETGTGTVYSAKGLHFQNQTPLGVSVDSGAVLQGITSNSIEAETILLRSPSGVMLSQEDIDHQLTTLVSSARQSDKMVLVHILDSSKTALGGPSIDTVAELQAKHGSSLMVIVDAAQMRLSNHSLHQYLHHGFLVLMTGSKFFTGPPLAGALLVPPGLVTRIDRLQPFPTGMGGYCSRYDLPPRWTHLTSNLSKDPNLGLLLRWKAAIWEMSAFYAVPLSEQHSTLRTFEDTISQAIEENPDLELIPTKPFFRGTGVQHWETHVTIFSFLVKKLDRVQGFRQDLTHEEARMVYRWLNRDVSACLPDHASEKERLVAARRCHIGQPVQLGKGTENERTVLRLASGARLVSGVHFHQFPEARLTEEIQNAKLVLEKLSIIIRYWESLTKEELENGKSVGTHPSVF